MKKLTMGAIALIFSMSAIAQSGKVISAFNYMQSYQQPDGNSMSSTKGEAKNLDQAARLIDEAVADPSTSGSAKAWWYRSNIYQLISSEPDSSLRNKYPKASLEVVRSFQKMKEINDPKFKSWDDAYQNMKAISSKLFNDGIGAFNKKNYHDAYLYFYAVSDVEDVLAAKGQKIDNDLLSKALGNAGLAAENDNDYTSAIAVYKKLLPMSTDAKAYVSLVSVLKRAKDTESAKKYTDEALAKYPTEKDLLIDKINFYMADGKFSDAISYLQKAITQDPKNEQLQSALGIAYDQIKDTANARKVYESLLVLNPNSFEANYGIGGMIFNQTKPIQEKMNNLGATKEDLKKYDELKALRDSIFAQAKPYLDKALAKHPDDAEVKKALTTIDAMTRK